MENGIPFLVVLSQLCDLTMMYPISLSSPCGFCPALSVAPLLFYVSLGRWCSPSGLSLPRLPPRFKNLVLFQKTTQLTTLTVRQSPLPPFFQIPNINFHEMDSASIHPVNKFISMWKEMHLRRLTSDPISPSYQLMRTG